MQLAIRAIAVLCLTVCVCEICPATIVHSEPGGDPLFSTNNMAPTDLGPFNLTSNEILGLVANANNGGATTDVFTFEVPVGFELSKIVVDNFTPAGDPAFIAIDSGTTFPYTASELNQINDFIPGISDPSDPKFDFLGGSLFSDSDIGDANGILQRMGGVGASFAQGGGFTGNLAAGDYTIYVQQIGSATTTYHIDIQLTSLTAAVPEPSSGLLMVSLGCVLGLRRKRAK